MEPFFATHLGMRQILYTNRALALCGAEGIDWMLFLDQDEVLCLDPRRAAQDSLQVFLGGLNPAVGAVHFHNLELLPTSLAGYALARSDFPGKCLVIGAVVVSLFLHKGYAIIPTFDLVRRLGLLNTLWSVILVNSATGMVVNTFLFTAYFMILPRALEEAATLDGAGPLTVCARIAMPLSRPMITTVALFELIDNWNSFFIPLVFTLGRPELRTVAVGMYAFVGQHATSWTLMCAAAVMSLLPTLLLFFLLQRLFVEGLAWALRG